MTRLTPALALLLAAGLAAVAAPVPKGKKGELFPHTLGTKWEYMHDGDPKRVYVEEVVESTEKDGVVTFKVDITTDEKEKKFEVYRLKDGELVITETQDGTFDPPLLIAKEGMKAGDEWTSKATLKADTLEFAFENTLTVGKAEEITTPAGKFTATPVTRTQPGGGVKMTFWFAEGAGMIRQTTEGQKEPEQELKAFTPGKAKK